MFLSIRVKNLSDCKAAAFPPLLLHGTKLGPVFDLRARSFVVYLKQNKRPLVLWPDRTAFMVAGPVVVDWTEVSAMRRSIGRRRLWPEFRFSQDRKEWYQWRTQFLN